MASAFDYLRQMLAGAGDPDQQRWAETQAQQPAVLQHFQNVLSDVPVRLSGTNSYDPNRSLAQNALDPRDIDQATSLAMMVGPGAIRAYHGSPHNFDQFDINKIGTGEGAQAYGHGLYFAENEGVARSYRDKLALPQYGDQVGNAADLVKRFGNEDDALKALHSALDRNPKLQVEIDAIRSGAYKDWKPPGHMYEVNLHADPEALLNYDKPLVAQSDVVKQALGWPVREFETLSKTGGDIYDRLSRRIALAQGRPGTADAAVSRRLLDAGVPGIRYLDQGSRGAGEGSYNYSVFDPKIIEIMRKYGIVPPLAGAGLLADQQ